MTPCPDVEDLERVVVERSLDSKVSDHLLLCTTCRELAERVRSNHALLDDLVVAVGGGSGTAVPALELPGYTLQGELHRGGQGVVYRAFHVATRRTVALKLLIEGSFASLARRARFEREIDIASSLRHPHIVTIYDRGVTAGARPFFVMEYIRGHRLGTEPGSTLRDPLRLFAKICAAVSYAHQRGVIHRDLKPANILIDAQGEPHVLDFGLAKLAGTPFDPAGGAVTMTGEFMGTLAYASPEQLSGDPTQIDTRTDVYSLGVILYELLTGRLPHPIEGHMADAVRAIIESEPLPPRRWSASAAVPIDDELECIVLHALAKRKDERYQSAGELLRDLERHERGEPIEAKRANQWYVLRKVLRRHRAHVAVAGAFVLLLCAATVIAAVLAGRARDQSRQALAQAHKAAAVSGFLREMLQGLSPDQAKGRSVPLRDVLEDAARRLEAGTVDEPQAEAELRFAVGRAFRRLCMYAAAEPHVTRAASLARDLFARDAPARAEYQLELAAVQQGLRRFRESEATLREVVLALEHEHEPDNPSVRSALGVAQNGLALTCLAVGRSPEADGHFAAAAALLDDPSPNLAIALRNWSGVHLRHHDLDRAESFARRAVEMGERCPETETVAAAGNSWQLASVLVERGQLAPAEQLQRRAHALLERLLGADRSYTVLGLAVLAALVERARGYESARPLHEQARAQLGALRSQRDKWSAEALGVLGELAFRAGDYEGAEGLLRESIALYDELFEQHSWDDLHVRARLAFVLAQRGQPDASEAVDRALLPLVRTTCGDHSGEVAGCLQRLAWSASLRDDRSTAEDLAREALAIVTASLPEEHAERAAALLRLGRVLRLNGAADRALPLLEDALARIRRAPGERRDLAEALTELGDTLFERGALAQAEPLLREALELRRARHAPEHPDLAWTMNSLARVLLRDRPRVPETRDLLEQALAIFRRQGPDYLPTDWVLGNLGALHLIRGETALAEPLFEEALERSRRLRSADDPLLAIALSNRAHVAFVRKQYAAAEPLWREAYEILDGTFGPEHAQSIEVAGLLGRLYQTTGDAEQAAHYRSLAHEGESGG